MFHSYKFYLNLMILLKKFQLNKDRIYNTAIFESGCSTLLYNIELTMDY